MTGIETLTTHIYHEKQEPGSMLCAQHALNSLLRASFAPFLEQNVDQGRLGRASANMDDTGFFSVQVLENALNVWGQSLIRWRSEVMQPYHNQPQYACSKSNFLMVDTPHRNQRAFILNSDQHWFTLRRFGSFEGVGHWYNLDSSLDKPEWVSETYLAMVLQQAEAEGYSTFVVIPTDPTTRYRKLTPITQHSSTARTPRAHSGLEDEDLELQAALQASLGGAARQVQRSNVGSSATTSGGGAPASTADMSFPPSSLFASPPPIPPPSTRPTDKQVENPVAASMARNQATLERMRREQEAALRGHYHDEVARSNDLASGPSSGARNTDAELQAALRASLETVSSGFFSPRTSPPTELPAVEEQGDKNISLYGDDEGDAATEETASETLAQPQDFNIEDMRRRRLARFDGPRT
ncbi:Josephin-domain-containing protein [Multifurca ochricompacta]|uniref:ubiquitinyl hydrolase 1 n=1 Tax=Multifurca ochricompacta TaxID=376703 RepID=A0AAD4QQR4_9AGAM|nr:Josephin-domain-containing protein [Multifurca ochricompacta]